MNEQAPAVDPYEPREQSAYVIERNRRLLPANITEKYGMAEYSDPSTGRRLLAVPRQSEQARLHQALSEKYIPVFPFVDTTATNMFLSVPGDARSLHGSLRFIARDLLHYGEMFYQLGEILGRCQASHLGLPRADERATILEGIVYSSSDTDAYGGAIHLAPPYELAQQLSKPEELRLIQDELVGSEYFKETEVSHLLQKINEGWNHVRS
jgi:hypothetical protein